MTGPDEPTTSMPTPQPPAHGDPAPETPTPETALPDPVTTSRQPPLAAIGGFVAIIAIGLIVWVVFLSGLLSGGVDPMASPSPSPNTSASAELSEEPSSTPEPTPEATEAPTPTPAPSVEAGPIQVTWTAGSGIDPEATVNDVAFLDGQWVAVGGVTEELLTAAIWTSDDGSTWTRAEIDSTQGPDEYTQVTGVAEIDGALVAIGSWGIVPSDQVSWMTWRSTDDGATWTESRDGAEPTALQAISSGGPGLIAAGWNYGGTTPFDSYFVTSTDGLTWERTATFERAEVHAVDVIGDRLVAVGLVWIAPNDDREAAAWYSDDDGVTWTPVEVSREDESEFMFDLVQFGDGLAAIGGEGSLAAWITTDGETWERSAVATNAAAFGIGAVDGGLVAVGNGFGQDLGPGMSWTSTDATAWEEGDGLGDGSVRLWAVAGEGDLAVAVGACQSESCETVVWSGEVTR